MKKTAKKLSALLLSFIMIIASLPITAINTFAAADVAINKTNFPDANFRAYVLEECDTNGNGALSSKEIVNITEMNVSVSDIKSLKGIEYFTSLKGLYCEENKLTSLDVSKNTALTDLFCWGNYLTSLDLSKNTALTVLACAYNCLTSIDVSKNTALTEFSCYGNQLTNLDVSKNTALTEFYCNDNQLTNLDISKNTALTDLDCGWNQLTSLEVSKNTALINLYCNDNELTSLDLSKNTALKAFDCTNNQLTSLDLSKNTALAELYYEDNRFPIETDENGKFDLSTLPEGFDISKASDWNGASVNGNILTVNKDVKEVTYNYDVGNGKIRSFTLKNASYVPAEAEINETNFPDANFRTYIGKFDKDKNGVLSKKEIVVVDIIDVYGADITSLKGIEYFTELTFLSCGGNRLTSLDVSKNTALTDLYCDNSQLTSIDVSNNATLTHLDCYNNKLTSLDVSNNSELYYLGCFGNQLTSLDVSNNSALTELFCYDNRFPIEIDKDGNFDLSTLPEGFDISKASDWNGASVNGNILTVNKDVKAVTYTYDMGNGKTETFTLKNAFSVPAEAEINETNFPDAKFRAYVQENFDIDKNGILNKKEIVIVDYIDVSESDITSLKGIEYFTELTELWCIYNNLTILDLSKNTALTDLYCGGNQLTSLDISNNTALVNVECYENQLTSLDLSKNIALEYLDCLNNKFTIKVNENSNFDLSTLPGKFDVSKARDWNGAKVNGNILTVNRNVKEVTYTYDMGNGEAETFTLIIDEPIVKIGDVNGDNEIKIVDARWILQSIAGTKTLNDTQKTAADLNKDGNVSIVDARWVLQVVAGTRDGVTLKLK